VYLVAFRITDISIECPEAEPERTYKDIIEEPDVNSHNGSAAYPPSPSRNFL
jgi:hypothetical protein